MFFKEKDWIYQVVAALPVDLMGKPLTALDIGSGSVQYRTEKQSHVGELFRSVEQQGFVVSTLDMGTDSGADYICDISNLGIKNVRPFSLVFVNNIIEHISLERLDQAISNINSLVDDYLIVTSPLFYTWHFHPIDNGLRLSSSQLADLFGNSYNLLQAAEWEDEHYAEPYRSMKNYPKPWVSGVLLKKS